MGESSFTSVPSAQDFGGVPSNKETNENEFIGFFVIDKFSTSNLFLLYW